jgi:hypothetical protein
MNQNFLLRYFWSGWIALGLAAVTGAGCSIFSGSLEVKPGIAVDEVFLTVPDSLTKSAWMKTFLWTVTCEAAEGKICEGSPTLLIPQDKLLCRHESKLMPGTEGNTERMIQVQDDSSLKVNIRAIGGPDWDPYISKIVLQVQAVGIAKDVDQETRKVLNCRTLALTKQ